MRYLRRMKSWKRPVVAGVMGTVGALALGSGASAHVGVDQQEVVAGESATLTFVHGHGCGDSPTTSLRFQIPESVHDAVAWSHPGWDVTVEREELATPIESAHGDPVTERPATITFTARDGFEIPNGVRDGVRISFTAPEEPGTLFFKVIQGCAEGSNDWIEEWDGTGDEPDHPAPSVQVVAASAVDGGDAANGAAEDDDAATTADDDGDGNGNGLAIAGVVLGAIGTVAGGASLLRGRRDD